MAPAKKTARKDVRIPDVHTSAMAACSSRSLTLVTDSSQHTHRNIPVCVCAFEYRVTAHKFQLEKLLFLNLRLINFKLF